MCFMNIPDLFPAPRNRLALFLQCRQHALEVAIEKEKKSMHKYVSSIINGVNYGNPD
jgi:hypothetical protein